MIARVSFYLALFGVLAAPASAADTTAQLLELFRETCGKKPTSNGAVAQLAEANGFVFESFQPNTDDFESRFNRDGYWRVETNAGPIILETETYGEEHDYIFTCRVRAADASASELAIGFEKFVGLGPAEVRRNKKTGINLTWSANPEPPWGFSLHYREGDTWRQVSLTFDLQVVTH
jgi:hypothetical protein